MQREKVQAPEPRWSLYVTKTDRHCLKAMELLSAGIKPIDVAGLTHYPPFLDGVPILADNKNKHAYKGSQALSKLAELKEKEIKPSTTTAQGGRTTMGSFTDGSAVGTAVGVHVEGIHDTNILAGRVKEQDVSDYMLKRTKVTDSAVKKAKENCPTGIPLGGDRCPPGTK